MAFSIKQLKAGQSVKARFGVRKLEERKSKNGKPYWRLKLTHPSGSMSGIVWQDAMAMVQVLEGGVAEVEATVQEYRGKFSLTVTKATPVADLPMTELLPQTPTVIIDPVYVVLNAKDTHQAVVAGMKQTIDLAATESLGTAIHPPLCRLVMLGLVNPHSHRGLLLVVAEKKVNLENEMFSVEALESEAALLKRFWEVVKGYDEVISFGGKRQTSTSLYFRSLANQIEIGVDLSRRLVDLSTMARPYGLTSYPLEVFALSFGLADEKTVVTDDAMKKLCQPKVTKKSLEAMVTRLAVMSRLYGYYREKAGNLL